MKNIALDDKYRLQSTTTLLNGIEALVRLPMLQQQRDTQRGINTAGFISGYRGSPLGGLDQALWSAQAFLDEHKITFIPGVNEELAATAVRGSQEVGFLPEPKYDGVFSYWYGKGPGLDRSIDAIRHGNAAGCAPLGGVLAVVGDDHGCKSSSYPYQSEHLFASVSMPVLAPANVQEILDFGIIGWEMSRFSGCWVGLKTVTENIDTAMLAEINPDRVEIVLPTDVPMPKDGVHVRLPDNAIAQEKRLNEYKIYAAREFAYANNLNPIVINSSAARFGIVASGKSYLDVMQALEDLGITEAVAENIGLRVYKVGMPWPLEPKQSRKFAEGLESILVVEEKRSVIEDQLKAQLFDMASEKRPILMGEFDRDGNSLLSNQGELNTAVIAQVIGKWLASSYSGETCANRLSLIEGKIAAQNEAQLISARAPMYCSGCPHNTSTQVPDGSIAGGGIGCHYMGLWSESRPVHGFTQMGGEGVTFTGQAAFTGTKHIFQNLGDGTYFHSGVLAIRQSVASKVNITYKILFNDAVAMTGGQPVDGTLAVADLIQQLKGEGVRRIELVSDEPEQHRRLADGIVAVSHRDDVVAVQKLMRETPGCTVLIFQQTCATEKRRRRKRGKEVAPDTRIFINDAVCEGCGDCSAKSNCLSVLPKETELGRKRQIDQAACNKDYSCVNGFCPSFVSVIGGQLKRGEADAQQQIFPPLPDPLIQSAAQIANKPWNIVVTGVGGTGVLTLSAVLAMAAHLEGKGVTSLNQTGLAQKFGPVVSFLRIAEKQTDIRAARVGMASADLLLACDLVVAASPSVRACLNKDRSHAVVNETVAPTAEFVSNPDTVLPEGDMKAAVMAELRAENTSFIPATELASGLMGDCLATNLFMLGMAYQKGLIPISAEAINRALEMNGVQIEFNQQAFLWGRRAAVDEQKVTEISGVEKRCFKPADSLEDILAFRVASLTAYQDSAYADRYLAVVDKVKTAELAVGGADLTLTKAVAKNLHKVMAYKDEYEVARLYSDGSFAKKIAEQFEGDFRLEFHLAPPLFSKKDADTGHLIKRRFGAYMLPMYGLLARMKFLRGTAFDIFGRTEERKMERGLIVEMEDLIDQLLPILSASGIDKAVELVELVNSVRGFGHIKARNYQVYKLKRSALLTRYKSGDVAYVELRSVA